MINLKEHFKLTVIYSFFAAFPALLQLIVYPIIEGETRLGATDFGHLAITEAIISVVFIFCTFGTGSGLYRFYYDYRGDSNRYNKLVSTVLNGILGRGILLLGLVFLFSSWIGRMFAEPELQDFGKYGPALVIAGMNRSIVTVMLGLFRNEKRLGIFVVVSLASGVFRSMFQVTGVLFYDLSFLGYVYGTAAGSTLVAMALVAFLLYRNGFHYSKNVLRELFPFARPLFFSDLIVWGLLFADRFFLLGNPPELGIYDNAMKFAIGIQLVIQGLTNAIQPEIFNYLKEGLKTRTSEIKSLSNIFLAESIGIILLAIIPVMLFITFFYETELRMSAGLVTILFARFILTAQYKVFAFPLMYVKKTRIFLFINSGCLLVNLGLNWWLTPVFGFYGAITAFFAAYFIQTVFFYMMQQRYIPIKWNMKKIFYFPWAVVSAAILLEIAKLVFQIDPFVTAAIFIFLAFAGIIMLYKNELAAYLARMRKSGIGENDRD
jgi:O-antigen/teichoic acid export membrane protein